MLPFGLAKATLGFLKMGCCCCRFRSISGKKLCSSCGHPLGKGAAMIIETLGLYFHIQCFRVWLPTTLPAWLLACLCVALSMWKNSNPHHCWDTLSCCHVLLITWEMCALVLNVLEASSILKSCAKIQSRAVFFNPKRLQSISCGSQQLTGVKNVVEHSGGAGVLPLLQARWEPRTALV